MFEYIAYKKPRLSYVFLKHVALIASYKPLCLFDCKSEFYSHCNALALFLCGTSLNFHEQI